MRRLWLAAVPLTLIVGCGSSGSSTAAKSPRPVAAPTTSAAPVLDTQGKIFCTLIDKVNASFTAPDAGTFAGTSQEFDDQVKASSAGLESTNKPIHDWAVGLLNSGQDFAYVKGATLVDDTQKARQICESQGWVGNP